MDAKNTSKYAAILKSGRWFAGLEPALQEALLQAAIVRNLTSGERLFSRGDPPSGLYAVAEGSVRIVGVTDAGKEVMLALVDPPGWFGEIAVFDRAARTHDAIAQTEASVVRVPQEALDALLQAEPRYWRDLGLLLTTKLRLAFLAMEDIQAQRLAVRLARRLLITIGAHGEWVDRSKRVVDVRQEQLATMLGTSRQTMNALLKDYEAKGLVRVSYGQIEILDFDGLRRVATSDVT